MDLLVAAYARSEGVRIDGRRILVDVERGEDVSLCRVEVAGAPVCARQRGMCGRDRRMP